ncbi:MAG TPA: ribosome maturation factor RimM [Gaiellaceae bacterium]|nr:ribosome maturation factor RimM [Gaiellaceae bacterium]
MGRVGKPHGVGGAFVVEGASDDPDRFAVGTELLVAGEQAHVEESKRSGGRLVIRLDRRPERGSPLEVPRSSLPPTADDEYYVADLIGLEVVEEEGRSLGNVRDVSNYAANDVLELDSGLLLPLVEDCVRQVDLDAGRIVVSRGFADGQ